jgi:hypothetical protein
MFVAVYSFAVGAATRLPAPAVAQLFDCFGAEGL